MNSVIDILEELEATPGRNDREDILFSNRHNDLLKKVFIAAQDPYVVYHVNKFKMPPASATHPDDVIVCDLFDVVLPELSSRRMTGNAAKAWVEDAFSRMSDLQQKWCQRIILKNLRCGVQESTVNKIWPGTINSFAVALAATLKSEFVKGKGIKLLEPVKFPIRVEPKLDGLRCVAVKQNGIITFFTRNGSVLETMPKIKAALESASYDNVVLDGECMGSDWNESASVLMSSKSKKDDANITYFVFDSMPLVDWIKQSCDLNYEDRCKLVHSVIAGLPREAPVKQVQHITASNEDELKDYFARCMDDGYEGVMLKSVTTPYVFKRSANILKLKPVVTYEGVIVGHYEGRRGSKREGQWGGFEVVLPNGVVTRLGGGFTDAFRAEVQLNDPESYLGKIVELEAQPDPLTPDGLTVDGKARFPVFCRFRSAKDVDPAVSAAGAKYFDSME